ncbi:helix-turn-helix transcriptional regulator [Asanoa ishikariensis]|uniref:Regulatory protein, luxR family n=1 Tax=Asanoa ishikariensis TaxID=137265 RepID=A0A1H3NMU2_9ACTN|nr:helix-turn-helix transcriptional regulator [Asanoa ishikariensis]GIF68508.1 helix-turn-helix transcriptional regulator [Asanoa ishikariensis]SDY90118.1 regulatory protein, luxR family [Asanoa ishikariensis]
MESALVSPVFVGRAKELGELRRAASAVEQGDGQFILVRGEAGVGKSRLVEEFVNGLDPEQAVTARGRGVEIDGDSFPFAPFTAVLRAFRRRLPDEVDAAIQGQEALLARIVPELVTNGTELDRHGDEAAHLYEIVARLLERLAFHRLLVVIIEDLHWADAASRQLLEYLVRTPRSGRLLIIATYRTDDIHRRHPLRPFLAEMDRLRTVHRIEVARFDRVEVANQLVGLLGGLPEPAVLDEIFHRSDGNAFFVEELARLHREQAGLGLDDLRDVLLARLDALPEPSQRIAQVTSQSGAVIGYPLLRAVAGLSEDELTDGLRAIMIPQILVPEPDGSSYRFRHSLVRQAVGESLLPGERARINRRFAEVLEADPTFVPGDELTGRLAQHWYAAHDAVKALRMSVAAADVAGSRYAHIEQQRMLERALELWDQVPDDVRSSLPAVHVADRLWRENRKPAEAGPDRLDLLATAVDAARCGGNLERALHLTGTALESMSASPGSPSNRAAWFWVRRSQVIQDLNLGDGWQELQQAQEALRDLPPSFLHASLLTYIANWSGRHQPGPESLAIAERAVDVATEIGTEKTELRARIIRSWLRAESDLDGTSVAELYEVRQRAETLGLTDIIGRANQNLPWVVEGMGRSAEAITAARHGIEVCRERGMADAEAWVRINLAVSLFAVGDWVESEAELDRAAVVARSHKPLGTVMSRRAYSLLLRGHPEPAAEQVALARELLGSRDLQPQLLIPLTHYGIAVEAGRNHLDVARAEFLRADADGLTTGPVRYALPMLCTAARIEAEAAPAGGRSTPVLEAVRRAADQLETVFPVSRAFASLLRAELGRAGGLDDPQPWAAAVAAFEPLNRPYELAVALLGQGRALLTSDQGRQVDDTRLARAYAIASSLGAAPLVADIAALTGGTGIPALPSSEPPPGDLASFGLTAREVDVLRLVARGYSNLRIANELYISQKTTSNHITHILAKLRASSRTEAVAIAHRHGLPVAR